jgi:curli production assembly/transport component CsgF
MLKKYILIVLIFAPILLAAQSIVYKPINPSFLGGNSFNAQWLLSQAEAQKKFKEASSSSNRSTDLDRFVETLNRQLLNQLSRDLFQTEFGDSALTEGTFTFGSLVIEIVPTSGGLSINILDTNNGEQTQIIVPN